MGSILPVRFLGQGEQMGLRTRVKRPPDQRGGANVIPFPIKATRKRPRHHIKGSAVVIILTGGQGRAAGDPLGCDKGRRESKPHLLNFAAVQHFVLSIPCPDDGGMGQAKITNVVGRSPFRSVFIQRS